MGDPVVGHGTLLKMEMDPTGSPGVFTTVGNLGDDIQWPGFTRASTVATCHNHTITRRVFAAVLNHEPFTCSVYWSKTDTSHTFNNTASEGLLGAIVTGQTRGFKILGPGAVEPDDTMILSGQVTNIGRVSPVREGVQSASFTIEFSGPVIIDGVSAGT